MTTTTVDAPTPWYRSLDASQWKTVFASNLGWAFDGYETFSLILVVGVALRQLLDPSQYAQIPTYAGTVIGVTLLGWGVGGVIGGVLADYIGRRRTMVLAILAYSITTGLSALAWDWISFMLLRFVVGIGKPKPDGRWNCANCNYLNNASSIVCEACQQPWQPKESAATSAQ